MNWLDWVLLIILVSNLFSGFAGGLIYKIGTTTGGLIGLVVAGRYYNVFNGGSVIQLISFLVIFGLVSNLTGLFFKILNRVFNLVAIIPGMKTLNRLGGGLLGMVEGAFFMGLILIFINQLSLPEWAMISISDSMIAAFFINLGQILLPLFPEELRGNDVFALLRS